jgi:hypothetical protein
MSLSGSYAVGGIDDFGEVDLPRNLDYISTAIPSSSTYDVSQIRYRYMSRAFPLNSRTRFTVIVHGVPIPRTSAQVQVRARFAQGSSTWQPWMVLTGSGSVFTYAQTTQMTKVQVEVFGTCQGVSVYEGDQ